MTVREKAELIVKDIKKEQGTNPVVIFKQIAEKEYISIHGPEHHILDGASLLVAYKNAGGEIDLEQALDRLMSEGLRMPGAMCGLLDTFLYEAIFIPEGVSAPPKDIINQPDLQVYVKDFGKNKGDLCLVAQVGDKIVGAVWVRIMNDYGHIDNETPSFAISLLKEYRNYGIGTELMKQMLTKLKLEGYKQASLSVQKMNYAVRMYRKIGFEIIDENDEEYIMICKL